MPIKKKKAKPRKASYPKSNVEWRRKAFRKSELQHTVDGLNKKYNQRSGMAFVVNKNGYGYSVGLTPKLAKDGTYWSTSIGPGSQREVIDKLNEMDRDGSLKNRVQNAKKHRRERKK